MKWVRGYCIYGTAHIAYNFFFLKKILFHLIYLNIMGEREFISGKS